MRSTGRPWLTFLACVAAAGGVNAQVQGAPGDAGAGVASNPPEEAGTATNWVLPPLRLSGSLSYDMRATREHAEGSSLSHLVTGSVTARTFIYQPWLAQVGGTLNLTTGWSRNSASSGGLLFGDTDASLHEQIRSREQFVTGNARLDLFPLSRFPFEAHVERSDSRISSGLAAPFDFRTQNIGFSQRYRPVNGAYTLTGSYDHRTQSDAQFRGTQDAVNGDFTTRWKWNELSVGLSHSRAETDPHLDESRFSSLVTRHTYSPSAALSVNSTVNWTRTQERASDITSDVSVLQGNSIGIWRRDGSPLTLTASARGLALRDHASGAGLDSGGFTLGANYEVNQNLRLTGTGGATLTRSEGGNANSFTGSVGASYQGDEIQFGGFRYNWFGSGSFGASLADASNRDSAQQQQTVSAQVGHTISRAYTLTPQSVLAFTGSQSVSWSHTRNDPEPEDGHELGRSVLLLNTVGATWQMGAGDRSAYARATYNDSMELGGGHARFRLFNFQLSGSLEFDNRKSLVGSLTYQRTLERPSSLFRFGEVGVDHTGSSSAGGEITFSQQRPFGIAGLRFVSRVRLAQDVLKQPGTLLSLPDRETRMWENRVDWSIGRLEAQLALRLSQVDGRRVDSLTLRVQRTFGD